MKGSPSLIKGKELFYKNNKLYGLLENIEINSNVNLVLLESKKQIILYGPPGTDKTFISKEYVVNLLRGIENE